jgi:hypothetical protein
MVEKKALRSLADQIGDAAAAAAIDQLVGFGHGTRFVSHLKILSISPFQILYIAIR